MAFLRIRWTAKRFFAFRRRKKEKRDKDEAHGNDALERRQMDGDLSGDVGIGLERGCADDQHDDRAGHGLPGEWKAEFGNAAVELAGVCDLEQPGGGRGFDEFDYRRGWICECESDAELGSFAGGTVLYGRLSHDRWDDEHRVLTRRRRRITLNSRLPCLSICRWVRNGCV